MFDDNNQSEQSLGYICCERQLGSHVFLGRIEFPEGETRPCVIQFLPDDGDELKRRRFTRAAMIGLDVSRDHENLLSVMHFGVWQDGRLFIALDSIEGRALSEIAPDLSGQFDTIASIVRTVMRALHYLHERGVVHGGVVAGNVLFGADGRVRLGRFNEARRLSSQSGLRLASPASSSVSPGQQEHGDELKKNDFRLLGGLLFELLAGKPLIEVLAPADDGAVDVASAYEYLPLDTPAELLEMLIELLSGEDPMSETEASSEPEDATRQSAAAVAADARLALASPVNGNGLSDAQMENMVGTLMTLLMGLFDSQNEKWHSKLMDKLDSPEFVQTLVTAMSEAMVSNAPPPREEPPAPPPVPPVEPPARVDPPRTRIWGPATVGLAALALVIAFLPRMRDERPQRPVVVESRTPQVATPPETEEPTPTLEPEMTPTEPAPEPELPAELASESPWESLERPEERKTVKQPRRHRSGQPTTLGMKQRPAYEKVDGKKDFAASETAHVQSVLDRHMSNARGVMVSVTQGMRVLSGPLLVDISIFNGSRTEFHVAHFQARAADRLNTSMRVVSATLESSGACEGRTVPSMVRCVFTIRIDESENISGQVGTLSVSNPKGESIVVTGLRWP